MDRQEFQKLNNINKSIPREWIKTLVTKQRPFEAEKTTMERIANSRTISPKARQNAQKILDSGMYNREYQVIDEKVAKKIEDYVSGKVKAKIQTGEIKPKQDSWDRKLSRKR